MNALESFEQLCAYHDANSSGINDIVIGVMANGLFFKCKRKYTYSGRAVKTRYLHVEFSLDPNAEFIVIRAREKKDGSFDMSKENPITVKRMMEEYNRNKSCAA